jgi:pimeloyl-ACP methyl ester carboxylesterase
MQAVLRGLQILKTGSLASDPTVYDGEVKKVDVGGGVYIWSEHFASARDAQGTAVLIAGTMDDCVACWRRQEVIDPLVAAGLNVIILDNRGFGCSSWPDFESHPFGLLDLAQDTIAVIKAWGCGSDPLHLVGHSMGGAIVQQILIQLQLEQDAAAAAIRDSVRSVVFISTYPGSETEGRIPAESKTAELRAFEQVAATGGFWEKKQALDNWQRVVSDALPLPTHRPPCFAKSGAAGARQSLHVRGGGIRAAQERVHNARRTQHRMPARGDSPPRRAAGMYSYSRTLNTGVKLL